MASQIFVREREGCYAEVAAEQPDPTVLGRRPVSLLLPPPYSPAAFRRQVAGRGRGGGVLGHLAPGRGAGDFMSLQDTCAVKSFQVHVRFFSPAFSVFLDARAKTARFRPRPAPFRYLAVFIRSTAFALSFRALRPTSEVLRATSTCYEHFLRAVYSLTSNLKSYLLSHDSPDRT
jgi:hypothetical protein